MASERFSQAFDIAVQELEAVGGDIRLLDETTRTLLQVHAAQGIIDNGGLQYFFECDFPDHPEYGEFAAAFRRIGASEEALLLEEAVELLGLRNPHLDVHARQKALPVLLQDTKGRFTAIDNSLCGNVRVWGLLDHYISGSSPGS